jgi:hypothetical protein
MLKPILSLAMLAAPVFMSAAFVPLLARKG